MEKDKRGRPQDEKDKDNSKPTSKRARTSPTRSPSPPPPPVLLSTRIVPTISNHDQVMRMIHSHNKNEESIKKMQDTVSPLLYEAFSHQLNASQLDTEDFETDVLIFTGTTLTFCAAHLLAKRIGQIDTDLSFSSEEEQLLVLALPSADKRHLIAEALEIEHSITPIAARTILASLIPQAPRLVAYLRTNMPESAIISCLTRMRVPYRSVYVYKESNHTNSSGRGARVAFFCPEALQNFINRRTIDIDGEESAIKESYTASKRPRQYLKTLPSSITARTLRIFLKNAGIKYHSFEIHRNPKTNAPCGGAFFEFDSIDDMLKVKVTPLCLDNKWLKFEDPIKKSKALA
eukprot:TRINITY_DN11640_c0_g1_i1.p1 TRINITY_DN11640_c0_g1~~TRINITY_DN11640_c0_g1_i1.p1  ORF type:complete len:403 (-),score=29.78 TRINITY_DN11640_c0_g1_i1:128-1168(-)